MHSLEVIIARNAQAAGRECLAAFDAKDSDRALAIMDARSESERRGSPESNSFYIGMADGAGAAWPPPLAGLKPFRPAAPDRQLAAAWDELRDAVEDGAFDLARRIARATFAESVDDIVRWVDFEEHNRRP